MSNDKPLYVMRTGFDVEDQIKLIVNEAKQDPALLLCLRANEIHIYYKGGKILGIKKNPKTLTLSFDEKYLNIGNPELSAEYEWLKHINKTSRKRVENNPKEFFNDAKKIMDIWFDIHRKQERDDQHKIALNNVDIIHDEDLAVVDIEFAVSANSPCYNREYKNTFRTYDKRYPNPRFDIIAINKQGQIYVFELKTGLNSTKNCETHITDFAAMIGSEKTGNFSETIRYKSFLDEMSEMIAELNQNRFRNNLSPLPDVDKSKAPIFGFAYTVEKEAKAPGHTPDYQKMRIQKIVSDALEKAIKSSSDRRLDNAVEMMYRDGRILSQVMLIEDDFKLKTAKC